MPELVTHLLDMGVDLLTLELLKWQMDDDTDPKALGTQAVLPDGADVANAVGAITSQVVVKKQLRIMPGDRGGFIVEGLAGLHEFTDFSEADRFARKELTRIVREKASASGTSCQNVTLETCYQIPVTAGGDPIFVGRIISAGLTGRPDMRRII